jgi:hypothetical protein
MPGWHRVANHMDGKVLRIPLWISRAAVNNLRGQLLRDNQIASVLRSIECLHGFE